jgi:hypothetical protein
MFTEQLETVWIETTDADIRDVVLMARVNGYVCNLERGAFRDEMYAHQRELKARYRNAYNVEMCLGQAAACGVTWGISK